MRRKIVAGNWKMNGDLSETEALLSELKKMTVPKDVSVIVAPPFTSLLYANELLREAPIFVSAQNMHQADKGAYTGEISAAMLRSVGVNIVILGHSERRAYFGETDEALAEKVTAALSHQLTVIFCFGEELDQREAGTHFDVVESQLRNALFHLSEDKWSHMVLAYEPVWAIGTGKTASPEQAQEMHAFIRNTIAQKYSSAMAEEVSILYGGSVKPGNAAKIFGKTDVDGGLIGGASLVASDFEAIVHSF